MSITSEEVAFLKEQTSEAHKIAQGARRDVDVISAGLINFTTAVTDNTKVNTEILIEMKSMALKLDNVEKECERGQDEIKDLSKEFKTLNQDYIKSKPLWDQATNTMSKAGIIALGFLVTMVLLASVSVYVSTGGKPAKIEVSK